MLDWSRFRHALTMIRAREFSAALGRCPFCGWTLYVWLDRGSGLRCGGCSAGGVQLSIGWVLHDRVGSLRDVDACEFSARGAVSDHLRRHARSVATSEYFADAAPGSMRNGVRCEDIQQTTYADASFDLVTHTEVLEHVPDDARAMRELLRILRPGGTMVFTVPVHAGDETVERARLVDGVIDHLETPVHHTDPLRPEGILAFRDYGRRDLPDRLRAAGFVDVELVPPSARTRGEGIPVFIARKPDAKSG